MSRSLPSAWLIVALTVLVEAYWLMSMVLLPEYALRWEYALGVHCLCAIVGSCAIAILLKPSLSENAEKDTTPDVPATSPEKTSSIFYFLFTLCLAVPLAGILGLAIALVVGQRQALLRHRDVVYWQLTRNAELPYTTPIGRVAGSLDSRSLNEQIAFSTDSAGLYNKVLAAGRIRSSLSVATLKQAIRHPDERIRLTAYQTLDKKTSDLNLAIQRLEHEAAERNGSDKSNTWLQIASNYWELLTLEQDEPVARKQLLDKAKAAAQEAIAISPSNRNAHFLLGRLSLALKEPQHATTAFRQSIIHGMPREKAVPYMAEAAFEQRDFESVALLLDSIDPVFKKYPPLSKVAEYWA